MGVGVEKLSLSLYTYRKKGLEGSFIFKRYVLFACYHAYQFVKKRSRNWSSGI